MADSANGWEILNALAQTGGAIGTTGALIVAAFTYRRQVDSQRSAQASRVLLRRRAANGLVTYVLRNDSELPVTVVDFIETAPFPMRGRLTRDPEIVEMLPGAIADLWPGEAKEWTYAEEDQPRWPAVMFFDAAGRRWMRNSQRLSEIRFRTSRHPVHVWRRVREQASSIGGRRA